MNEIDPAEALEKRLYLAWLTGFRLPSYQLIARSEEKGFWYFECEDEADFPASYIGTLWELPPPKETPKT